jgi:hypothetical protein
MKFQIVISVIFFLALGLAANYYLLKLTIMPFIGIMLLALLVLGVVGNFFVKANRKRKGVKGEADAFIFPDKVAKGMKKMDLGIQYEASVLSSALLILGIVLFLIYFTFFTQSNWVMKGLIIFNSLCGGAMMGGMLVTYYQQLVAYRESTKFLRNFADNQRPKPQPIKKQSPIIQQGYEEEEEQYPQEGSQFTNEEGDYYA